MEQTKQNRRSVESGGVCIDTRRILDACRTKECIENAHLMLTSRGHELLQEAAGARLQSLQVLSTGIEAEPLPFRQGHFRIRLRYYLKAMLELSMEKGVTRQIAGLCVAEEAVVLYGGEGRTASFSKQIDENSFLPCEGAALPQRSLSFCTTVEVAQPVALRLNVVPYDPAGCFGVHLISAKEVPSSLAEQFEGPLTDAVPCGKTCYLSFGLFALVRTTAPAQLVIPACDLCVPAKSGCDEVKDPDPCALFRTMEFPVEEFCGENEKD